MRRSTFSTTKKRKGRTEGKRKKRAWRGKEGTEGGKPRLNA